MLNINPKPFPYVIPPLAEKKRFFPPPPPPPLFNVTYQTQNVSLRHHRARDALFKINIEMENGLKCCILVEFGKKQQP